MSRKKSIVIGSGLSGLAIAIRLAVKGFNVTVLEANAYPGGKVTEIEKNGYRFDAGPSLFTMPHFVDELFEVAGRDPRQYFEYIRKDISCQYFWDDGTQLTAWGDTSRFAKEVEDQLGVSAEKVETYLRNAAKAYQTSAPVFLEKSLHKTSSYLSADTLKAIASLPNLHLRKTLHQHNQKKLSHPKLVQLFDRYATYNGSSPYLTPGVMHMIPHLEYNIGTFYPRGGIHSITKALFDLAKSLGVNFHFNERVEEILWQDNQVSGVRSALRSYEADIVVSNMDIVPSYRKLMPQAKAPEKTLKQPRSSSALIFYWGIKKQFPELDLHNIFFADNYEEEFRQIFEQGSLSDDATVYVNITSKEDPSDAPTGSENWFVMVNVPPNTGQDWDELIGRARKNVMAKLNRVLKVNLEELIEVEEILEPRSIERKTSSFQGALYGASSNNQMAAFLRHPNFSSSIKGLYFCGGSVHPGGGIPLVLLSARITADLIKD